MGDPKKSRKKYSSPKHPWRAEGLSRELYLIGTYGLRNKRELWRAQSELSRIRKQARLLHVAPAGVKETLERQLLLSLSKRGLVGEDATLDDVLSLTVEDLLQRRLQSLVASKGLASSPHQARQMVVQRHVKVEEKIVNIPGYMVYRDEESSVGLRDDSPLVGKVTATPVPSGEEGG